MDDASLFAAFEAEGHSLLSLARSSDGTPRVPGCPDWTLDDLVAHVASVYEHKIVAIQTGLRPVEWTRDRPDTVDWLEDAHARMGAALLSRSPGDEVWTWFEPQQDVRFWMRRMAQETFVHRIDAQQALGLPPTIDSEMASDGIDECLECFVSSAPPEELVLSATGETIVVHATDTGGFWSMTFNAESVEFSRAALPATATVSASAANLLLWLYARGPLPQGAATGSVQHFEELLAKATQ